MKAISVAVLLLFSVSVCTANTYYISPFGDNTASGVSPSTPWADLEKALSEAESNDKIVVQQGLYSGTANTGQTILSNIQNLTIHGESGPEQTIFWCEGTSRTALTTFGSGTIISGIQFSACGTGLAVRTPIVQVINGKFVQCDSGIDGSSSSQITSLLVSHVDFEGNTDAMYFQRTSVGVGGNVTVEWSTVAGFQSESTKGFLLRRFATVNIIRTNFLNLFGSSGLGTALFVDAGNALVQFCNFTNNAGQAGLVYASGDLMVIDNSHFHLNVGDNAAALYHNDGVARVSSTTFTHNVATNTDGGAVYSRSQINMQNVQFIDNIATRFGGGAFFDSGCAANIRSGLFSRNNGTEAGGAFSCDGAAVNLFDSTLSDNVSDLRSSSAYQCNGVCKVFKTNTKLINNTAEC